LPGTSPEGWLSRAKEHFTARQAILRILLTKKETCQRLEAINDFEKVLTRSVILNFSFTSRTMSRLARAYRRFRDLNKHWKQSEADLCDRQILGSVRQRLRRIPELSDFTWYRNLANFALLVETMKL
jgi:hypothetical protein